MCSGKGAGSPQGYNTGVVPPAGGMQQFANIQNQFQKSPWDATLQKPNTLMGSQPGLATTQPVSMYDPSGGTLGTGGGGPNTGYGAGGLDPNPRTGNPPMMPPVSGAAGLLGGNFGTTPNSFVNGKPDLFKGQAIDPVTGGYVPPDWMFPGSQKSGGMTPAEWALSHGNGANGGPMYNPDGSHYTREQRLAANGFAGGAGSQSPHNVQGWANNKYNPANRDPNAGANRMAAAAAYQQSLTPEMIQQQINNGQRAPTSYTQMQGMLEAMDPAARADYIAKYKARTGVDPTAAPMQSTPGNIFGD